MEIRHMNVEPAWAASGVQEFFTNERWVLFHTFIARALTLSFSELKLWQKRRKPFFVSIMSVAPTLEERKKELRQMVRMLLCEMSGFQAKVGVQLNVDAVHSNIVMEVREHLNSIREEDPSGSLVVIVKLASTAIVEDVVEIGKHERCDGLCLGNRRPRVCDFIRMCRSHDVKKHLNVYGMRGALPTWKVFRAGVDSISVGPGSILGLWRVLLAILVANVVTRFRFHLKRCNYPSRFYRPKEPWARYRVTS